MPSLPRLRLLLFACCALAVPTFAQAPSKPPTVPEERPAAAPPEAQPVPQPGQAQPPRPGQPAQAPAPTQPQTLPPSDAPKLADTGSFMLPNATLTEIIDILARRLKINFILDPAVKGSVSVFTYGEVKQVDYLPLLETLLRVNGAAMIKVGRLVSHRPDRQGGAISRWRRKLIRIRRRCRTTSGCCST